MAAVNSRMQVAMGPGYLTKTTPSINSTAETLKIHKKLPTVSKASTTNLTGRVEPEREFYKGHLISLGFLILSIILLCLATNPTMAWLGIVFFILAPLTTFNILPYFICKDRRINYHNMSCLDLFFPPKARYTAPKPYPQPSAYYSHSRGEWVYYY